SPAPHSQVNMLPVFNPANVGEQCFITISSDIAGPLFMFGSSVLFFRQVILITHVLVITNLMIDYYISRILSIKNVRVYGPHIFFLKLFFHALLAVYQSLISFLGRFFSFLEEFFSSFRESELQGV